MTSLLVTGLSGLIGTACKPLLARQYTLTALNRRAVEGVETTRASLENYDAIRPAFDSCELVLHMAAKVSDDYGWDDLNATNVVGTRNVLEAARDAGVRRVVFISSGATAAGWEHVEPYRSMVSGDYERVPARWDLIDESIAPWPRNLYAATKVWGEAIGRHYADNHGMEVICLRIGFANEENRPTNARQYSVWNSHGDVANAILLSLEADLPVRFESFFILSDNRWSYRDISRAREVLGYEPADRAEDYRT